MGQVAAWMDEVVTAAAAGDESPLDRVRGEVADFVKPFPIPGWSG
jgi:glycine hydroxymethyltransferase